MAAGRLSLVVTVILIIALFPAPARANKWLAWLEELSGPGPFRGNTLRLDIVCSGRFVDTSLKAVHQELVTRSLQAPPEGASDDQAASAERAFAAELAALRWCNDERSNVRFSIGYEHGWWDAKDNPRYQGTVRLRTYTAVIFVPVRAPFLAEGEEDRSYLRALEVGLGLSAYRLTGTAVVDRDYWRLAVPLRARVFLHEALPLRSNGSDAKVKTVVRNILKPVTVYVGLDYIPGQLPSSAFRLTDGTPPASLSQSEWVPAWGFNIDVLAFRKGRSLVR